jgi:DnaK suppressor protein
MNASVTRGTKQAAATKTAASRSVASKSAGTPGAKTAPKKSASKATSAAAKPAAAPAKARARKSEEPEVLLSGNKASAGSADTIQKPAAPRAREVATKQSKQAAPAQDALLTEEQILQMPEKDYMNEAQLAFFRNRLQQLERDLLRNAGETTEHLRETVLVPDPADRATIEEEHALELRTRDRERKLLKKVQQSLASIETGDYGWCEETGEPIGIPRLLARPTATLSLEAQQRRELKQKLYGD